MKDYPLNVPSQDTFLKWFADNCQLAVVSIGYRLAPEHPFPAGPEDCFDAAEWLVKKSKPNYGADLMFIGGEVCRGSGRFRACNS